MPVCARIGFSRGPADQRLHGVFEVGLVFEADEHVAA
jgi:hypothetical protein